MPPSQLLSARKTTRSLPREPREDPASRALRGRRLRPGSWSPGSLAASAESTVKGWVPHARSVVEICGAEGRLKESVAAIALAAGLSVEERSTEPGTVARLIVVDTEDSLSAVQPRDQTGYHQTPQILVTPDHHEQLWSWATTLGVDRAVTLPSAGTWLVDFLSRSSLGAQRAGAIAVVGASGGVGASTLSTLLAAGFAHQRHETLLIDADPWGSGLEHHLGVKESGLSWQHLSHSEGSIDPDRLSQLMPQAKRVSLLGFAESPLGELPRAKDQVLEAARRHYDVMVMDLMRGQAADAALMSSATSVICLVHASLNGLLAAGRVLQVLPSDRTSIIVRGPMPEGVDRRKISRLLDSSVIGEIPQWRNLARLAEWGNLPTLASHRRVQRLCDAVVEADPALSAMASSESSVTSNSKVAARRRAA